MLGQAWQPLFNGVSFDGWTTQNGKPVTAAAWKIEEGGILHLDTSTGRGGNIVTDREFGNFEMLFEWKISMGGNNGIKYRVSDFNGRVLGIEYQVIDDSENKLKPNHKTASLYDIYDSVEHDVLRPAGEWNRGRIVVAGNSIEHWLNGHLVSSASVGSDEWIENIAKSKFHDVEGFGTTPFGKIMITDHRDEVWYRSIFIRELGAIKTAACRRPACECRPFQPRRRLLRCFRSR